MFFCGHNFCSRLDKIFILLMVETEIIFYSSCMKNVSKAIFILGCYFNLVSVFPWATVQILITFPPDTHTSVAYLFPKKIHIYIYIFCCSFCLFIMLKGSEGKPACGWRRGTQHGNENNIMRLRAAI